MTTTYQYDPHSLDELEKIPSNRSFGLTVGIILLLIGLFPLLTKKSISYPITGIAAVLLLLALLFPKLLTIPNKVWMKLGALLNKVVAPIVIGSVFFLIVTPYAFFLKMIGKKFLALDYEADKKSYWVEKDPVGPPPEGMKNQF